MKKIRVLHCPAMVGGHPQGLARAERKIGIDSLSVAFTTNYLDYRCDEILWRAGQSYVLGEFNRWRLLCRAIRDFDIIHFNFGRSIMPHWISEKTLARNVSSPFLRAGYRLYSQFFELKDLPLLKKCGKGIVVTYQGSDARQMDYCREQFEITFANEPKLGNHTAESDGHRRREIAAFAKYADRIYSLNPDLLYVLPREARFVPYAHIDLNDWRAKENGHSSTPLVIHAPSNKEVKGTQYILDAVARLKSEGVAFEFMLIEGLSNKEARKVYEKADLLIDQLLTGWYGGVAVELMALGKPVICYIREDDLKFIPDQMRSSMPIINATPATIYAVLKEWLTARRNELPERGRMGRRYVETWHDQAKIAEQMKGDYEAILSSKVP